MKKSSYYLFHINSNQIHRKKVSNCFQNVTVATKAKLWHKKGFVTNYDRFVIDYDSFVIDYDIYFYKGFNDFSDMS